MKAFKTLFSLAIIGLSIACLNAQPLAQDFKVLSPSSTDTVKSGSLLVIIKLPQNHQTKANDYRLILDGKKDISDFMILRKDLLSVIYNGPLEGGRHYFELLKKPPDKDNPKPLLVSYFYVKQVPVASPPKPTSKAKPKKKPFITGNIRFSTSDAEVTGPGAEIRQEPPQVRDIGINLKIRAGKGYIPLKGFYTTNAQGDFTYRNHFLVGYIKDEYEFTLGDHFVNDDPYTFTGIRVRGARMQLPFYKSPTKLIVMYGQNVDALIPDGAFPPNPDDGGNLYASGTPKYQRNYLFIQVKTNYKTRKNFSTVSFSFSKDIAGDELIPGIAPQDNTTLSYNLYAPSKKSAGYFKMYMALSYSCMDNTIPGQRFIITMNSSMVPLFNFKDFHPFTFDLGVGIPITKYNLLEINAKRLGGAFIAHGNPYLLNNRQGARINNRTQLFKNKFHLNLFYDYMIDNLSEARPQTRENSAIGGSFSLRPSNKLPSLTIGYRYFLGNTFSNLRENFNVNNTNIFGSLQYTLRLDPMTYQIVLSRNDMNLVSQVSSNNRQEMNSVSFSVTFKNALGLSVQGSQTKHIRDNIEYPQQYLTAKLWYRIKKPSIRISLRALSNTMEYLDLGEETRQGYEGGIDYTFKRYLTIGISAGYLPFTSYDENRTYTEQFLRVRGSVRF